MVYQFARIHGRPWTWLVLACWQLLSSYGWGADPIRIGMSTALSGPSARLGQNVRTGVQVAVLEQNRTGGIHGRPLELICRDDGYEPSRTIPNVNALVDEDEVVAIVGNVGTPTAVAALPIFNAREVVLLGAYTGSHALRNNPPDRWVVNYRASYAEETAAMVDALMEYTEILPNEVALFTQRDSYGQSGYEAAVAALRRHGLTEDDLVAHGRYDRNSTLVEEALADILLHAPPPKAIIMVGTYGPSAKFIRLSREYGLDPLFLNVSFVGGQPLVEELGRDGEGVIVTQVVPHFDADLPVVDSYRRALRRWAPVASPSCGGLEGYIVTQILIQSLETSAEPITRQGVVDRLESLGEFDVGLGKPLWLSPNVHQACHEVWPTVIREGQLRPYSWDQLRASHP